MNQALQHCLIEALKSHGIAFGHWKSNAQAAGGALELLVERAQAQQFEQALARLGFKRAIEPLGTVPPSIAHFYGLDQATGALLHVHVQYRVIAGESLLENDRATAAQRAGLFLRRAARRLRGAGQSKQLASGGALIAFVGPEATGKSTLVHETAGWLGGTFEVATAHLGKPPSTWLTFLPNLALPLLRQAAPQQRMSRVAGAPETPGRVSLLYAVRSVLLAWDRRALATRVRRRAAAGGLVICDRYPSPIVGAMDSARLKPADRPGRKSRLLGLLAALENRIYRQMPPPDLVIRLTVPVEVALQRNKDRIKKGKEADEYVLRRHTMAVVPTYPTAKTIEVDSNQPRSQTIQNVRQVIWEYL